MSGLWVVKVPYVAHAMSKSHGWPVGVSKSTMWLIQCPNSMGGVCQSPLCGSYNVQIPWVACVKVPYVAHTMSKSQGWPVVGIHLASISLLSTLPKSY